MRRSQGIYKNESVRQKLSNGPDNYERDVHVDCSVDLQCDDRRAVWSELRNDIILNVQSRIEDNADTYYVKFLIDYNL
jgi:hypothetical protein